MSSWFVGKSFLAKEQCELEQVAARRVSNSLEIEVEQLKLRRKLTSELSGLKGLSLSFGAGCATVLAYKNREHLSSLTSALKELPWNDILRVAQEYQAAAQDPLNDEAETQLPS